MLQIYGSVQTKHNWVLFCAGFSYDKKYQIYVVSIVSGFVVLSPVTTTLWTFVMWFQSWFWNRYAP